MDLRLQLEQATAANVSVQAELAVGRRLQVLFRVQGLRVAFRVGGGLAAVCVTE